MINYNTVFASTSIDLSTVINVTAHVESAYTAAQLFIANECPVLEQRLKTATLRTAVTVLTFALVVIDWAIAQIEKREEYAMIISLAAVTIIEALPVIRAAVSEAIAQSIEAYRPAARFARRFALAVPGRADRAMAMMFQLGV